MSLGVNDPTPLKGGQIDHQQGILPITASNTSVNIDKKDDLVKFIQNIKQKPPVTNSKSHDMGLQLEDTVVSGPLDISHLAEGGIPFSTEYKPVSSVKSNVYSVNELLKLQQNVPEVVVNSILLTLPKKSFWRLAGRGHSEGRNSHIHNKENGHDKKGSRNRNSRNNGRRNNQNNNNNRNHNHESLKEVSKDELLAMEEKLQPTGNSMADFEKWRAQVRELERKKKGLPSEVQQDDKLKPASSLSNFFNFKKEENTTFEELEPSEPRSATPKGSSSRFSSFFSNASISTASLVPEVSGSSPGNVSPESTATRTGDFRLMSLFNKDEKVAASPARSPSEPAASVPSSQEQSKFAQQQPAFAMQPPSTTEKSSQFFQSLMTKGKTPTGRQDQIRKTAAQQPSSSPSQSQFLEKISGTSSIQPSNAPPGLAKVNAPPGNVPNVPPPGFPMHFAHSHMLPPINGQIAMPPPGFQNFTMAPPPGMFNGSVVHSDQNAQSKGAVPQSQVQVNRPDVQAGQQSKQQRPPLQDVTQHELQHDTSQDVQHMTAISSSKRGQQALPPQFINPPGNMPLPPIQGGQPQFNRQLPAGFAFYGQKMVPQHPAGFGPYGQNMIPPQPPAAGFTPYGQNVSQPLPGFNPYGQSLPSQLQQQKK